MRCRHLELKEKIILSKLPHDSWLPTAKRSIGNYGAEREPQSIETSDLLAAGALEHSK
jgi:hypothetical protein